MRKFVSVVSFLFLALVGATPLVAQETKPPTEEESFDELVNLLNTPVISASKSEQTTATAPAKIVVITSDDIRLRGYMGIDEIFNDIAGVDVAKGRGVEWETLFMRGIRTENTDRFLLIWDGVIQNDTWKYNVWISRQYPLMNIDRIEVMYGPSSLLYGANAFSGIINVILKKPKDVNGFHVLANGGSYNTGLTEVNYGKERGDWRFMANARYFRSDEMDMSHVTWKDNAGRTRYQDWVLSRDGARDANGNYVTGLKVVDGIPHQRFDGKDIPFDGSPYGETRDWMLQGGVGYKGMELRAYYWYRREIEDAWYIPLRRMHGPWTPTGMAIYFTHDTTFGNGLAMKTFVKRISSGLDVDWSYDGAFTRIIDNNLNNPNNLKSSSLGTMTWYGLYSQEYRAGQQLNYNKIANLDLVGGWEYTKSKNYEDYNTRILTSAPWTYTHQHDERNEAVFANGQWSAPSKVFSVAGGLRFDHNYVHGEKGGFGNLWTKRMAGIWSPADQHRLKLIYGEAFQAPSPWHKFATIAGERDLQNPTLKPEKLKSTELIYEFIPTQKWRNSLSVYKIKVTDIIATKAVPFGSGTTLQNNNVGSLEIRGEELETRYFLDARRSIFANATWSKTEFADTGARQGDLAPFKANAGAEFLLKNRFGVDLRTHFVSARDTINKNSPNIYTAKHVDAAFTADAAFTWLNLVNRLDVKAQLYNIFNEKYYIPGLRSGDGRTYNAMIQQEGFRGYVGVTYRFE